MAMLIPIVRKSWGHLLIEVAPALWIILLLFTFPLTIFGTLGMRYAFLNNAAHLAASLGAQCKTFQANVSSTDLSAVNMANQAAEQAVAAFSGISLDQVSTCIVVCPIGGSTVTRQSTPLTSPANTSLNTYNFEVVLQAQIQPLMNGSSSFFGSIPGLTGPLTTSAKADIFFENTQGLNQ